MDISDLIRRLEEVQAELNARATRLRTAGQTPAADRLEVLAARLQLLLLAAGRCQSDLNRPESTP